MAGTMVQGFIVFSVAITSRVMAVAVLEAGLRALLLCLIVEVQVYQIDKFSVVERFRQYSNAIVVNA